MMMTTTTMVYRNDVSSRSMKRSSSSLLFSSLLLLLISLNTVSVSGFVHYDCGCPETCTVEEMYQRHGAPWRCWERIHYMVAKKENIEVDACYYASKQSIDEGSEQGSTHPCSYELCHPIGCNSSLAYLLVDGKPHNRSNDYDPEYKQFLPKPPTDCGCPNTCDVEKMDEIVEGNPLGISCRKRMEFLLQSHYHSNEYNACVAATEQGYCDVEACHPEHCGSTLQKPPPKDVPGTTASLEKETIGQGFGWEYILTGIIISLVVMIGIGILSSSGSGQYGTGTPFRRRGRREDGGKQNRNSGSGTDGVFRDHRHPKATVASIPGLELPASSGGTSYKDNLHANDMDNIELAAPPSASSSEDDDDDDDDEYDDDASQSSTNMKPPAHVPPQQVWEGQPKLPDMS